MTVTKTEDAEIFHATNALRAAFESHHIEPSKIRIMIDKSAWPAFASWMVGLFPQAGVHDSYQLVGIWFERES